MTHLLDIPENVFILDLFPYLDHNDLVRLRQVSKQTKAFAEAYLWMPQPGRQGKWVLKFDSSKEDQTLESVLQGGLPPPSRLHIANQTEKGPSEQRSFFEDEHLEEFMDRYSKYVTHLRVDKLFLPFTSAKEIAFYESLVNLKKLHCGSITTVGGAAQFEEKTERAEGSFLIRPTFRKLKVFKLDQTDCMAALWTFINGMTDNLEEISHPFLRRTLQFIDGNMFVPMINLAPVQELIERRWINNRNTLLYDFTHIKPNMVPNFDLRFFASCRDNGVKIKRLCATFLVDLLGEENGGVDWRSVSKLTEGKWTRRLRANYRRNQFVCSIIHSLEVYDFNRWAFFLNFPGLEELRYDKFTCMEYIDPPGNLGACCRNLKKLTINGCVWDNQFFLRLWVGLPLLENITLNICRKLTNEGFIGHPVDKKCPTFFKLKRLKHLSINNLDTMPGITDVVFWKVFRHLKLTSFTLSSDKRIKQITLAGIKDLLTGSFVKTIQKLDLDGLKLKKVSDEEMKKVVSRFRSSKLC